MTRAVEGQSRFVAVFGSSRINEADAYYQQARHTTRLLAQAGFAIVTGGCPGIMEAANRDAREGGGLSSGMNIHLHQEQQPNTNLDAHHECIYFFVRKMMFAKYAHGFLIFPGGYDTMDELFEALTLIQTGELTGFPVVLLGVSYWSLLVNWLREMMLAEGCIEEYDLGRFVF